MDFKEKIKTYRKDRGLSHHAVMLEAESGEARIVTVSEGFAPDDYASGDFQ